jgi:glycine/D-amino acid oxidase-like deaminating enzyme
MTRGSRPTSTSSPAVRGWANYSLKLLAPLFVRPSRIFFSSVLHPGMLASRMRSFRCGAITATAFSTEFLEATGAASKLADDTRGGDFDPSNGERIVSPATLKRVREYVAFRFPAMKNAPLLESRVCQYEQTSDSNFVVDRHPQIDNVWLLGGGSGHGFKHGPAIGEIMADLILGKRWPEAIWRTSRFSS